MKSNYSVTKLFVDKDIQIVCGKQSFTLRVPNLKEYYSLDYVNATYHLMSQEDENYIGQDKPFKSTYEFAMSLLFQIGFYDKFWDITKTLKKGLSFLIPELEFNNSDKKLQVNGIIITEEIWEYIVYILKLSCGEKVSLPPTFNSEEERKFYLAQKEYEKKIAKIRAKNNKQKGSEDQLIKIFLSIIYAFPSLTFEFLFEQTMAQIQWLQKYAAESVSYEVNAQAFAAGNMKKGKKLDFFIK